MKYNYKMDKTKLFKLLKKKQTSAYKLSYYCSKRLQGMQLLGNKLQAHTNLSIIFLQHFPCFIPYPNVL